MRSSIVIFVILFIVSLVPSYSQEKKSFPVPQIEFNPKHYICYKSDIPLKIDGKLNESIWQKAEWTDEFVDIEGDLKPRPRFRTRAKMLWDDDYFYFAAKLAEPDIWATLTERDAVIFYDNDFERNSKNIY